MVNGKWVPAWLHADEAQAARYGAHYHHLARYIVEGQTKQGRVALMQPQESASDTRRCLHATLAHPQWFRRIGRSTGMNQQSFVAIVPFLKKLFQRHHLKRIPFFFVLIAKLQNFHRISKLFIPIQIPNHQNAEKSYGMEVFAIESCTIEHSVIAGFQTVRKASEHADSMAE